MSHSLYRFMFLYSAPNLISDSWGGETEPLG